MSEFGFSALYKQKLDHLRPRLEEEFLLLDQHLLKSYPVESYAQRFDLWERRRGYHFVPSEISRECEKIATKTGLRGLELYHKILLVSLIENYEERQKRHRIPDSVQQLIPREFDRILTRMEYAEDGFYLHSNDLFAKDLGLCRLKLLPCGSEVVDVWSGIPRSTFLRGGVFQLIRGTMFLPRLGGFKPLYESHWDRRLVRQFTARQYDLFYARIADLLRLNSDIEGMFGSSWWFDPKLEDIAPELLFLRRTPVENGAKIFRLGPDTGALRDAVQFSNKRKKLYESRKYIPSRYMLVWARADILHWADRFAASEKQKSPQEFSEHRV